MNGIPLSAEELQSIRESTALTDAQIHRLYKRFAKLNKDRSGEITREEFNSIPALASNPLVDRVLAVMDTDGDSTVDFGEFVRALSVLSSATSKEDKLRFTFKMYDIDGDGRISNKDLFQTLSIMVGVNLSQMQLQQIVDKTFIEADVDRDGYITFEDFSALAVNSDFGDRLNLHF
ncbi:calcineurin b subunit (CNB) [Leptomonas pyrrhocoris]|uniref:Calcineurin b subunit (CNB) n=1 Tax=Leptomonas pyrrhocoris TaxID=157538 RepID=A0A0M9FY65_LEPPY|nr:calcineurin b subunit (CNB) [Leptomonas pyrrhocoris]XP_015656822.1 calcineurin b subunit (CNB) [Leptomonas pyrrhocoris]XP_015656823.1 calcineurin b subunit (CNB) [Leptomonas pyrrhocoris]KPA78382.1 calcineurin b subunit (CNB) [Leptomonas pyrrhocoris]KPA78383.1 calcineurin b subunit (CNB) [Leptomonas pyrrhocoris]KPA78384.1 calcineurin b subunit (CNB) [Leptomonas pyrrhocoris]|eukprot:XP_015656821.1 calcineurin b subunit (CNB) [Leptomonas pyrrhocoris]